MQSHEVIKSRTAALALTVLAGSAALTGCAPEYDGWRGCDQAEILPGVADIRPSINARLIELNDGDEALVKDSTHFANDTAQDAREALLSIYAQVYGKGYVQVQSGDKIPFCVTKDGVKSFDIGGNIEVKDRQYDLDNTNWLAVTEAKN